MTLDAVLSHVDADLDAATARLMALLRVPSISTDPAYDADVGRAARMLADDLNGLGFAAEVRETPGHPMVVAHGFDRGADADGPHVLFYGHYDVQPVDPLELWNRDPFDPVIEEQNGKPVIPRPRGGGRQGPADDLHRGLPRLESGPRHPARPHHGVPGGGRGKRLALAGALPGGQRGRVARRGGVYLRHRAVC